jgi:NACalpha-BTF3-like transcription factor
MMRRDSLLSAAMLQKFRKNNNIHSNSDSDSTIEDSPQVTPSRLEKIDEEDEKEESESALPPPPEGFDVEDACGMLMAQSDCSHEVALKALQHNGYDVIDAMMAINQ